MGKILAVTNQKGGVGKTTTCINLSSYVAAMGKNVLIVDIDPQGNASSGLGVQKRKLTQSIYHTLVKGAPITDVIIPTGVNRLDILPSNIDLAGAEIEMITLSGNKHILRSALSVLKNKYDYIFIDCPPSLGLLTVNALTACDSVLIPIQGEFFALEGLSQLMNTVKLVKRQLNAAIEIEGVLLTMYDGRSNLVNSVTEEICKFFGKKVFQNKIPRNVRLGEAPSYGLPIMQFEPRCNGAIAYKRFAEEFLERNNDPYERIVKDYLLRKKVSSGIAL